jgi:hypothetical protein
VGRRRRKRAKTGRNGNEAQKLENVRNWNTALYTAHIKNMKFHENWFDGSQSVPCGKADKTRLIIVLAFHSCCVDAPRNAYLGMYTSQNGRRLALVGVSVQQDSTVGQGGYDCQVSLYVCMQELKIYCSRQQSTRGYIKTQKNDAVTFSRCTVRRHSQHHQLPSPFANEVRTLSSRRVQMPVLQLSHFATFSTPRTKIHNLSIGPPLRFRIEKIVHPPEHLMTYTCLSRAGRAQSF